MRHDGREGICSGGSLVRRSLSLDSRFSSLLPAAPGGWASDIEKTCLNVMQWATQGDRRPLDAFRRNHPQEYVAILTALRECRQARVVTMLESLREIDNGG
jgi:hypothetical protein